MHKSEKIEIAIALVTILLFAVGWYFLWVKPHDEMVFWIMDCTSELQGQGGPKEIYEECHKKFIAHKAVSSS